MVEVMVVMGIFAIFTTSLFSLFLGALGSWDKGSGKGLSDTTASLALQKAAREIADGKSASVSSGTLTVQMPLLNNQGNYERDSNGDVVKLYVSGSTLYRQTNSNTAVSLATDIASATFSVSGSTVTITITAQGRTGKNNMQTQMTQIVTLRNVDVI
jgi:type II secretory pathway pseudopilin PulG